MHENSTIVAVATGLGIVGIVSLPAISTFILQLTTHEPKQDAYEDKDGKATPDSVKAYSAKVPKSLIVLFAALGFGTAISTAVLATIHVGRDGLFLENWLGAVASFMLLVQAIAIASCRNTIQAYNLGLYASLSCLVLAVILLTQGTLVFEQLLSHHPIQFALRIVEIVFFISLAAASLCIPRRPEVFDKDGNPIDRMYTSTALNRFTWGWPLHLLKLAGKQNELDLKDLPRPDHYTRAADLSADWKKRATERKLWLGIVLAHKVALSKQWLFTLGQAFINFGPQWVTLQLLRILESRSKEENYTLDVWMWVLWLGVVTIAQSWVESHVYWLSWAELAIPVRGQLSALIFEKSMRKKDVKGTGRSSNKKAAEVNGAHEPNMAGQVPVSTAADRPEVPEEQVEDEAELLKKSKQGVVNLIGVDCKRVSDFMSFQNLFPGSLFKLIVSLAFLVSLLGWKPLLAGFSVMLAIMPVNIYFSKRYSDAQDRLMKVRDEKLGIVNEALQGIRQIKFSALEPEWERKISDVRERELKSVWDVFMGDNMLLACWVTSPIALAAVSLAVYAGLYGTLLPSVAFVSLGVFRALEVTLGIVPELTTDFLDAWVSVQRIEEYLRSPEVEDIAKEADEVTFDNATIAWPADENLEDEERFVLRDLTVTFPKGELSVISGKTGSGKSLLLSAILGEVDLLSGSIYLPRAPSIDDRKDSKATRANWIIPGAVAYVAQIPWIENASIRENIEFGLPHDEERYNKTIEVCALKKDLEMLSDGEKTEIGANGINLSGGQKWRVTLARAIYSRAGILVFDDIFSAVDAHVGRHIFEKCLTGELAQGRTRILVTHHVGLVQSKTKYLVDLGDGKVLHAGLLSELENDGTLELIKSHEHPEDDIREDEIVTAVNSSEASDEDTEDEGDTTNGNTLKKILSKHDEVPRKFVEEEAREKGAIKKHVYVVYLKASGGFLFWTGCLSMFLLAQAAILFRSWWLRIWTGQYEEESISAFHVNISRDHEYAYGISLQQAVDMPPHVHVSSSGTDVNNRSLRFYLAIYVLLSIASAAFGTLKYFFTFVGSIRASRQLFAKLNFVVLRAPLRWLDTVPIGRVLNRFTADFHVIDSQLAYSIAFGSSSFLALFGVLVASLFVSLWLIVLAFVLLIICVHFAVLYLYGARPVKRLESNAKSPVFEQFGSALTGVATIRGFDKARSYVDRMYKKIDDHATATWHLWLFNRWMAWRMALVGSMFAVIVSVLILLTPGIDSALAGFALAFALEFSSCVVNSIRLYANLELNMNAAERIVEYTELPTETLEGVSPPAAWPTGGSIEVDELVVGYAPDLPPVLNGLTFTVENNQRVGVVGRTGAGKSSLTLALFRFLEARSGSVHIDGLDISKIKLHDLRSRLAIIPQDPVLFSGTIRSNLDPFDRHTDAALRDSLERVHLIRGTGGTATPVASSSTAAGAGDNTNTNTNVFGDLTSPISEGGLNLSQGQRQLLCLARAIVARPRVMVLDEATSAVDMATDALIQRSIREEFTDATLLVIAHRLSTIADFDRILVLSDGRVAEYGSPRELWDKDDGQGVFRAMCEESGEKERLRSIVFGQ